MEAISCHAVSKRYGTLQVLRQLHLAVPQGSIFGFLGPNGAGKTTLISILTTLAHANGGEASVHGVSVSADPIAVRRLVGYLPQEPAFAGWMRGSEVLDFLAQLSGVPAVQRRQRITEVLDLVGLADAAKRRVGGYSGGMKQRLGLAQALLHRPPVLILDEPVSSLDPLGRREVIEIINRLRGETTVFFSSHILDDIDRVCDHVAIIAAGELVIQQSMTGLKEAYARPAFLVDLAGDAAPLATLLQQEPWVSEARASGSHLHVVVRDTSYAERALPALVVQSGATLLRYEQALPSLEDIFVQLVHEQNRESA